MEQVETVQLADNWRPRFFLIWTGQALSLIGSALTQFVLLWWITETTGSAAALATAGVMALLPQAIFGPLGGVVADRWSRRVIMIVADAITALCMMVLIALFATGNIQLWQIYALLFVRSAMQAFQAPAATASTAMLVPKEWLPRVAGFNQTLQGVMTIAAAPLGALALAFLPTQGALMIDVVTALVGILPLLFFRIPQKAVASSGGMARSLVADLRAGVRYVLAERGIAMLLAIMGLIVMTIMPMFSLTPLLVKEHFAGGVNQVALMEGLSGVGIILGGLLIGFWPIFRRRIVTVLVSFAVSCFTVALVAVAPSDWFWLGIFWWFVSGLTYSTGNAPLMAIIQHVVPNEMQGRVFSLMNTVIGLAGPVGLAVVGPLGEALGVVGVFVLGGVLSALICLAGLLSPALMNIEKAPASA
ncbi:MAG: MFS transporter [Caldilinea sp. CFX5]|nr:MFS transporter [Caldilinea sp. CFX5]